MSVETNGCVKIDKDNYNRTYRYIMDVKCPSSGVAHKGILDNLKVLHSKDEVKFVIKDRRDYEFARDVIRKGMTSAKFLMSPMFDENNKNLIGKELVEWIIEDRLDVKVQIQLHKVLGVL